MVCVGSLGGFHHFFVRSIQTTVSDVLHDGIVEQPGILKDHAETGPQTVTVEGPHVMTVQQDGTAVDIIETHQQFDQGGLAGAGGADDGDHLTLLYIAAEVVDDRRVFGITEPYVVKGDLTGNGSWICRILGEAHFIRLFHEFKDPFRGCYHGLHHVADLGQLGDGLGEALHILNEGDDITHLDGSAGGEDGAGDGDRHIADVGHQIQDGHHQTGQELGFPAGSIQSVIGLFEGADLVFLLMEGRDDIMAGEGLFDLTVDLAQIVLLLFEVLLGVLDDDEHQNGRDRDDDQGDPGHDTGDGEHHDQHTYQSHKGCDEGGDGLVQ